MCLKMSLEDVQRSRRTDSEWQIVPYTRCSNSECSVANGEGTWHDQLGYLEARADQEQSEQTPVGLSTQQEKYYPYYHLHEIFQATLKKSLIAFIKEIDFCHK